MVADGDGVVHMVGQTVSVGLSELWDFIGSPSATTASLYYTMNAQDEIQNILENHRDTLMELGLKLDAANSALNRLQQVLDSQSFTGPDSYLGSQAPGQLRKILGDMQAIHDGAGPGWKALHGPQLDERKAHIDQKLKDLQETLDDLQTLKSRMSKLRAWLDSVRLGPDGKPRGPVQSFDPQIFIRLGSISLYMKAMGADVFGLSSDRPFHMVPATRAAAPAQRPLLQKASATIAAPTAQPAVDQDGRDKANQAQIDRREAQSKARAEAMEQAPEVEVDKSADDFFNSLDAWDKAHGFAPQGGGH